MGAYFPQEATVEVDCGCKRKVKEGSVIGMGFSSRWIGRIIDYLSTTRFSIVINGKRSGYFRPSRGIKQGCPLSPYLILICSQGLSSLLKSWAELEF